MKTEVYNTAHNESTQAIINQLPNLDGLTVHAVRALIDDVSAKSGAWCIDIADKIS